MSEWLTGPLREAVEFILQMIDDFATFPFPGTEIPVAVLFLAPVGMFLLWRVFLGWITDMRG